MDSRDFLTVANRLLRFHNLDGWTVKLRTYARTLGKCKYARKLILIDRFHVANDSYVQIMDTLHHEIAHALVGPGHGHNDVWQDAARKLGATPTACAEIGSVKRPPARWSGKCPACGVVVKRWRKPPKGRQYYHVKCGQTRGTFVWSEGDLSEPQPRSYLDELFG